MQATFRVDASIEIGTGHVMRCLTLADALAAEGADCQFICRAHDGHLIEVIRAKGYGTHALPSVAPGGASAPESGRPEAEPALAHRHWLGATQAQDARACAPILAGIRPDWLIVDHYALDARWELALKPHYRQLMSIDDLADRPHGCDVLLDQNISRSATDYRAWVPGHCRLLCGPHYALLRPEFAALRAYSLARRAAPQLRQILVNMGGVDKDNATSEVLEALRACRLPHPCEIVVVMGATNPWLAEVHSLAQRMPWPTKVLVGVRDMARLMAESDLAIGAAGSTAWERCCLGLPAIMLTLAANQQSIAHGLEKAGAGWALDHHTLGISQKLTGVLSTLVGSPANLLPASRAAAQLVDGRGVQAVMTALAAPAGT